MAENLMSPGLIRLYGREFTGLKLGDENDSQSLHPGSAAAPLAAALTKVGSKPQLARIYAFSFEGRFYILRQPSVFLVHGPGEKVAALTEFSGVAARDWEFEGDVRVWKYDRLDYTLRCDIDTGPLEDLLVNTAALGSRSELTSRSELASRSELSSRSELASRSELSSRSELTARHRFKG
jgi:hypothetical protein